MGLLSSALTPVTGPSTFWPQDVTLQTPNAGFLPTGVGTRSSITVTPDNALGFPAFFAAVRVLSEDIAKLPLFVYEDLEPGKRKAKDHYLYPVLHDKPNPEMTSFVWREASQSHLVTWGNCYSEIVRDPQGRVAQLWPIRPDRVSVRRDDQGRKFYRIRIPPGQNVDLAFDEVFHIPGLGYDGTVGYSVINLLSKAIELGLAAQEYGAQVWRNGARPGGILQVPGDLQMSDQAKERLKSNFEGAHQGLSNAQRIALLEDGITWTETQIPPADAQYIETRKFQIDEIARGMRIPPHKIGDLDRATFSNIEQQALEYVQDALGGWMARWEAQIRNDLMLPSERGRFFAEFNVDALLRGDSLTRAQALSIQRNAGVINADEWRDIENMNPLPDGTGASYWQPLNLTTVDPAAPEKLLPQIRDGLITVDEARGVMKLPPMQWDEKPQTDELVKQLSAGLLTIDEARQVMGLGPMQWSEELTHDEIGALLAQVEGGLMTHDEARAKLGLGPMEWGEGLSHDEVGALIAEVDAGLLTHDEARSRMGLGRAQWPDDLSHEEVGALIAKVEAGLLTPDEARAVLKMSPIDYGSEPSEDEIKVIVAQMQSGLMTADEAREKLGRPPVDWPADINEKTNQAIELIKVGFDPASVMAALELPQIAHLGLPPVTVQKFADAEGGPETPISPDVTPKTDMGVPA